MTKRTSNGIQVTIGILVLAAAVIAVVTIHANGYERVSGQYDPSQALQLSAVNRTAIGRILSATGLLSLVGIGATCWFVDRPTAATGFLIAACAIFTFAGIFATLGTKPEDGITNTEATHIIQWAENRYGVELNPGTINPAISNSKPTLTNDGQIVNFTELATGEWVLTSDTSNQELERTNSQ